MLNFYGENKRLQKPDNGYVLCTKMKRKPRKSKAQTAKRQIKWGNRRKTRDGVLLIKVTHTHTQRAHIPHRNLLSFFFNYCLINLFVPFHELSRFAIHSCKYSLDLKKPSSYSTMYFSLLETTTNEINPCILISD